MSRVGKGEISVNQSQYCLRQVQEALSDERNRITAESLRHFYSNLKGESKIDFERAITRFLAESGQPRTEADGISSEGFAAGIDNLRIKIENHSNHIRIMGEIKNYCMDMLRNEPSEDKARLLGLPLDLSEDELALIMECS